jgi:NADH:ubiquinone oxidoreductase subunit F (NADH-binding)/ferredoxin
VLAASLDVLSIGPPRLTAGLNQMRRLDLAASRQVFWDVPDLSADDLVTMAAQVDLRGRGGAAFPLADKTAAVQEAARGRRRRPMIVVNGVESDPGSAKDRMLLLRSPYLVLAGALAAAQALRARLILVGTADALVARSVSEAAAADPVLARLVRVMEVPDRFVSGESGALISAMNGRQPLPPTRQTHASHRGLGGRPTLLGNAETYAQLAVLAMLGPGGYATTGDPAEPGTVLLTVSGAVGRAAVVEVPSGWRLGDVLGLCGAQAAAGVLVGGYHGSWLAGEGAYEVPASRAGLEAFGGTLGQGAVFVLGQETCSLAELARAAAYLAKESSGRCGACQRSLLSLVRSLTALADGSGGGEALDAAMREALALRVSKGQRGHGRCSNPDGVARFVLSALAVFRDDLAWHVFRYGCGRPAGCVLPLPSAPGEARLAIDWGRCRGDGLCAQIVPELVQQDGHGYPVMLDMPVPRWLERKAWRAVDMCPQLALRLVPADPAGLAALSAGPADSLAVGQRQGLAIGHGQAADAAPDVVVSEDWITDITSARAISPPTDEPAGPDAPYSPDGFMS